MGPPFSINTNPEAFVALQQLTKTTNQLEVTKLRITTGLRVNGPKDDASNFAIATRSRGDIKGIESVKIALALAIRSSMSRFRPASRLPIFSPI